MAIIQITPESLRSEASKLSSLKAQHESEMKNLRTLILALNEQWKGAAQDAFVGKYNELQPKFTEFVQLLQDHINHMNTAAQQMEEKDNSLAGTMRSFSAQ